MAAHELQCQFNLSWDLDVLRDHISDSHQVQLLDVIMRNARRLQRLSRDIFGRIED